MTRLEKIELAIAKGYTADFITGKVFGVKGKEIRAKHSAGYIKIRICLDKKKHDLLAHQFIWYLYCGKIEERLDHINEIRDDNRIINLRVLTNSDNTANTSKSKGYCWHKGKKKWMTRIGVRRKKIYLGLFNTEAEAKEAYLTAKKIHFPNL